MATVYDPPLLVYDFSPADVGKLATRKDNLYSGKVQLDYKASRDVLLYANVSRGVKGGGFNTNSSGISIAQTPFKDEHLYAYEAGAKTQLFDRKLRVNGSIFYYDYHKFQGFAYVGLQGLVGNFDGNFYGGELEITARPTSTFTASLGVAYLKTKVENVPTAYSGVRNQESIQAPRWTVNGMVRKEFDVAAGKLALLWDFNYIDDRYSSVDNNPITLIPGSFVHDARITYTFPQGDFEVSAFVNNISDVDRQNFNYDCIALGGYVQRSFAPPRWWGVSLRKTF